MQVCCEGYKKVSNIKCDPICRPSCPSNSYCLRPNVCNCIDGYRGYIGRCTPVCKPSCKENSFCVAPNKCACNEGFKDNGSGRCLPICEPSCTENSSCLAPHECICNPGFKDNGSGLCLPICEPSCTKNSTCIAPNKCACNEGFKDNGSGICLPICEPNCLAAALQEAQICNAQCLCWQEFDEFGPLVSPKCMNICADKHDQPCLDLSQCQCDLRKTQLICRSIEDMSAANDDDPIFYSCKIPRSQTPTTLKPANTIKGSDMKSIQTIEQTHAHVPWTLIAIVTFGTSTSYAIYVRCRKREGLYCVHFHCHGNSINSISSLLQNQLGNMNCDPFIDRGGNGN